MIERLKKIFRFSNAMRLGSIVIIIALLVAYVTPFLHPSMLWILPLFGLAYPVILIATLLLIIYWSFQKSIKWVLILSVLLLIGYPYFMRLFAFGAETTIPENAQTTLTVVSNNVQIFDLYDSDKDKKVATRDSIFNYAINENPDIVCFQEFYVKDNPTTFPTSLQFKKMMGSQEYHHRYIYKAVGRQHFGVAMFSRLPVISKGDVNFETEDAINYNFCIYMDVVKNADTFRVYNVHLQSFRISKIEDEPVESKSGLAKLLVEKLSTAYPKRAEQALRINEHIASSPYPVIVCGDFNDTPVSFVYNQFSSHLTDAFINCGSGIGATYVGKLPAGRIDYLFHSPELVASNFKIQERPYSDHRAISCQVSKIK